MRVVRVLYQGKSWKELLSDLRYHSSGLIVYHEGYDNRKPVFVEGKKGKRSIYM